MRRLSAGQRRIWFLQTRDAQDITLNTCAVYRLTGALDAGRLRASVEAVAARHEILRATYGSDADGVPYEVVRSDAGPAWQELDLSELPEPSRALRTEVRIRRAAARPFDLSAETPLRCLLIRTGAAEFVFVIVVHAIGWDDRSWALFCAEVSDGYNGRGLPPVVARPDDSETDCAAEEYGAEYWRGALRPLPQPLELPGRTLSAVPRAERAQRALPAEAIARVEEFARARGVTPFAVLLAAYDVLIHRYTAATDFLVAVPTTVSAGDRAGIGYFGNTLLLRATLRPGDTFASRTAAAHETLTAARAHRDVGIDRVVRAINPERGGGRDGLEQLVRTEFAVREGIPRFTLDGLTADRLEFGSPDARIPLAVTVLLEPGAARVEAEYRADLLQHDIVDQLLGHYVRLLDSALAEPDRHIGDLDLFGAHDRAGQLERSHGELVSSAPTTLVDLFERRVAATPGATALIAARDGGDLELDYAALDRRANRLAHWLIGQGVGSEDIVGLRLATSVEFVIAVLAVLKAGAAYLPIDPHYPEERIEFLVADARPRIVLGGNEFEAAEQAASGLPAHAPADAERVRPLRPDNLAYVIYTSGSTGTPKGVPVSHAAIADHLQGFCAQWEMTARDRLLQSSSVSFDASLLDIFVTLTLGACLVVPKPGAFTDLPYVTELIARCGVTVLHLVPSTLSTLLLLPEVKQWRALRYVPVGGEALHGEVADRFAGVFDAELRNHYGPTEAVVSATHLAVEGPQGTGIVPIGRPNRNVYAYLLDERLQLVPTGVVGEIYLGGPQLARGYLDRPGATAERFVADPFAAAQGAPAGSRLYRTGDLARRNTAGELEFLGRADEQVKVRGYRIELGEVEAAIASHPSVGHCVATAVPDRAVGTLLAAYVVPAAADVDIDEVRAHAAATLPEYMVPAAFAVIEEIPLTEHGKLDRRTLPEPVRTSVELYREPATATEIRLTEVFGDLFGRDRVGADDSFFDLGGHSLLATRLLARIRAEFGVEIAVRVLFDNPTVAGLAALVEAATARRAPIGVER
ncbi:amino acid adenylation domain-containing protein [Nocardia sp. CDC159]|uniref:Amino acid adenylation domain-containing protein n=1 Tax=Nocardia pulmonis TaxID=2951408 RepID=A0A9X2EDD3_9NOCA|nr:MULTISPECIES: amino acid adenylation domain-containing protein [Nocardia]MCM6776026.1 amino acid adenylation domain-containing protein [Nocardia pulmonis]MCM6788647.1 amino acid adenylation domain-containing protein [Nocardia sp. CDC159]